ncbi:hypothetical protein [Paenibacillus xylaniclasticus]|uniref:hypothetical protein n=1 Tax=Paenibacillus xylaniclasticus TaxID=588083 RepID=UPI000FD8E752|nr:MULTISPECIES: hypothetical protein [Paenibacillus]GFN33308.1 hypothetical protein PCURB6_35680 [Paenibacillus curdlanolyticus]
MSRIDFVELFGKKRREIKKVVPIKSGEVFPYPLENKLTGHGSICLFISFTCPICIDLLGQLNEVMGTYSGNFYLFTNGSSAENEGIIEYFKFSFPVIQIDSDDYKDVYHIPATPYVYVLNSSNQVIGSGTTDTAEELHSFIQLYSTKICNCDVRAPVSRRSVHTAE